MGLASASDYWESRTNEEEKTFVQILIEIFGLLANRN